MKLQISETTCENLKFCSVAEAIDHRMLNVITILCHAADINDGRFVNVTSDHRSIVYGRVIRIELQLLGVTKLAI